MALAEEKPIVVKEEGRFARFESIKWWDQSRLKKARVFVVGAGAIGNEVIKNLAMLGIGNLVIADMDRIEQSNLTRSVLFRESDSGLEKATCAARGAKQLYPDICATPLVGNLLADAGLGVFRWADVVVGALDNREARVFVNSACARVGKIWIDGGIDVLNGIVRGFHAPATACYECTMSQVDWDVLNKRRSCSLLAQRAAAEGGTPTTPTTASVVGAMQAQEVVKLLHGMDAMLGRGFVFEGLNHTSYPVSYPVNPDCGWHETPAPIESAPDLSSSSKIQDVCNKARSLLGGLDALDFAREIVAKLECPACGEKTGVLRPAQKVSTQEILCVKCKTERIPTFLHSLPADNAYLDRSVREMGLPAWDIIWARFGEKSVGIEISGDRGTVIGKEN
jgi:molybdopterin/thiamine biosynthesis adenylyltransferase